MITCNAQIGDNHGHPFCEWGHWDREQNGHCTADLNFRPIGQRLLVQRYPLSEQSIGGVYVLGRDFPTLGRIIRLGIHIEELRAGDEVQWSIRADFSDRQIAPDLLVFPFDDINLRIDDRGVAHAVGNRVLLDPQDDTDLLRHVSSIIVSPFQLSRWSFGNIQSLGDAAAKHLSLHEDVIYDPSARSEVKLNGQTYFVVRDEDCIAVVEN